MTIRKVNTADRETIIEMFNTLDHIVSSHELKSRLFEKHFQCDEDFFGLLIEDNGKVIAYLGLIFADRIINNKQVKFCNLTSFLIDPAYRGQKLTHSIIDEVKKLGDYTITAITPIPSLYKMYESKGLVKTSDFRVVFWNTSNIKGKWQIIKDTELISRLLNKDDLQIYLDHSKFKCICAVVSNGVESILLVGKKYKAQLRKFKTDKLINYTDLFLRKFLKKSILDKLVETIEVAYCSNYTILTNRVYFQEVLALLSNEFNVEGIVLREDIIDLNILKKNKQDRFWRARQMFFSNNIEIQEYDTLYSEIYVLDLV